MAKSKKVSKPKKRKKQIFRVQVRTVVEVELDPSLLPDDEWRSQFYNIKTLEELAKHFAYNKVTNGITLISMLDGFADQDDSLVSFDTLDIDVEMAW